MEIILGRTSGFCGGVIRSVNSTEKVLNTYGETYCLGELVHNKQVVDELQSKGLKVVDCLDEVPNGSRVIIRAHGVTKSIYSLAKSKNLDLIDLTCVKVIKIHELAEKLVQDGYFIVLTGQKSHPETIGTISFCGENSLIVEELEELDEAAQKILESGIRRIAILAQTTYSMDKYDKVVKVLKNRLGKIKELRLEKTICNATELRQNECKELASTVDAMVIIGGRHSSNTMKLYDIASGLCKNTWIVETADDLVGDYSNYERVGVMAGASTPKSSIDAVIKKLEG